MHCVRGKSEPININTKVIEKALTNVCSIYVLSLTGGEPSLNVNGIYEILNIIKKLDIGLHCFYVVTNGKKFSKRLVSVLDEYIDYCYYPKFCKLVISNSQFHENNAVNIKKYLMLNKDYIEVRSAHYTDKDLINMGNAKKNGFGSKLNMVGEGFVIKEEKDIGTLRVDSSVYISSIGEIIDNCALSYDEMPTYSLGNVVNTSLKNVITNNECRAIEGEGYK